MKRVAQGQRAALYFLGINARFPRKLRASVPAADHVAGAAKGAARAFWNVPPLQPAARRRCDRGIAVVLLPGDPAPQVRRQPPSAPRVPAALVQPRSRSLDLGARGV